MTTTEPRNQLALLFAGPQSGQDAMLNDLIAMTQALLKRGIPADRILSLHGQVDRPLVLSFLRTLRRHMATWKAGTLFIYVSGNGFFYGDTAKNARPGLHFSDSEDVTDNYHLFWDEFFAVLDLPAGVRLTLLPDL